MNLSAPSLYDRVQLVADPPVEVVLPRLHPVPLAGQAAVGVARRPQELVGLEDEAGAEVVARLGVVVEGGDAARLEAGRRVRVAEVERGRRPDHPLRLLQVVLQVLGCNSIDILGNAPNLSLIMLRVYRLV